MRFLYRTRFALVLAGAMISTAFGSARGDSLIFALNTVTNGASPGGTTPYMVADFESTSAGTVTLTLTNKMSSTEFIPYVFFNYNPSTVTNLVSSDIAYKSGVNPSTNGIDVSSSQNLNEPSIKAGDFNIEIQFPVSGSRFYGGDTAVFTITDSTDKITAASFDTVSINGSGSGGYYVSAKVQGIPSSGGTKSGGIAANAAVPEPSSALLGLIGMAGMGSVAWLRRRRGH